MALALARSAQPFFAAPKGGPGMKGGMGGFLFAITHAPVSPFLPNSKCYTRQE